MPEPLSAVPKLLDEIDRLTRWQAEALTVMDGLQDLGNALGLPLGERITGTAALVAVERLKADLASAPRRRCYRPRRCGKRRASFMTGPRCTPDQTGRISRACGNRGSATAPTSPSGRAK